MPSSTLAQEPTYNGFEMIRSSKILPPISSRGSLDNSGSNFPASSNAVLPEHAGTPDNALPECVWRPEDHLPEPVHDQDALQCIEDQPRLSLNNTHGAEEQKKRRCGRCCGCCGLSRKAKWIVGVITALVLIGVLAGGIIGGLIRQYDYSGSCGGVLEAGSPIRNREEASQIAALSWTDGSNATRRAVFYQVEGALMLRRWDPDPDAGAKGGGSWVAHNISADFAPRNLNVPGARLGTPLAAAATPPGAGVPFRAVLYYLNGDSQIRELVSGDDGGLTSWAYGDDHPSRSAASYTKISAAADFCAGEDGGCRNAFCYAYQNLDQNIMIACSNDWDSSTTLGGAHPGGTLSLVPFAENKATSAELRLIYYTDTSVKMFSISGNSSYLDGRPILSNLENRNLLAGLYNTSPGIVAMSANHNLNIFALALTNQNVPAAHASWYANEWDKDKSVEFLGTSPDYSGGLAGVAMDHSGTFYAAAANSYNISEYSWNSDDPFTLTYVGVIDIFDPCLGEHAGCG